MATSSAPACTLCDGTGWKTIPDTTPRKVERCDCRKVNRSAAGVPREFQDASFDTYAEQPCNRVALKAAKTFLDQDLGDLYLAGGVGSGKTHLACAVLNAHVKRGHSGLFVRTPKLMLDLQLTYGATSSEDKDEARVYLETLFGTSLLVLDDVGVEKGSDHTLRTLYTVYEERCDRGLRTIWTSNLGLKELGEFLGDIRLPSRIAQRAAVVFLTCPDRRVQQRQRDRLRFGEGRDGD